MRAASHTRCGAVVAPLPHRAAARASRPRRSCAAPLAPPPPSRSGPALRPCRPRRGAPAAAWIDDLGVLFSWDDDAAEGCAAQKARVAAYLFRRTSAPCSAPPPPGDAPPTVVLDGANLMWGYGVALARRFGCKAYPASHGLLLALEYEPWRAAGVRVLAVLPSSYAVGELATLADGCGGDAGLATRGALERAPNGSWRNVALCAAAAAGRVQLVQRAPGERGRGDDDRELIRVARAEAAYACSNDQFREHFKLRGGAAMERRAGGAGAAPVFRNKKRFGEWSRGRRFGFRFAVAPGLDDALLLAMAAAARGEEVPPEPAAALRTLHIAPWREATLPVYFQPAPGAAMLTARVAYKARLAREARERLAAAAPASGGAA